MKLPWFSSGLLSLVVLLPYESLLISSILPPIASIAPASMVLKWSNVALKYMVNCLELPNWLTKLITWLSVSCINWQKIIYKVSNMTRHTIIKTILCRRRSTIFRLQRFASTMLKSASRILLLEAGIIGRHYHHFLITQYAISLSICDMHIMLLGTTRFCVHVLKGLLVTGGGNPTGISAQMAVIGLHSHCII